MAGLPPTIRKVVCYVRKSREDEEAERRGEDTLAKQREMLVSDVLSRFDVEYDVAEEVASGDSIAQRPVFRGLLPQLGHTYQAIVCKDLSRLGRGSYSDMGIVYDTVRQKRVFIITKDSIYDPRNFSDLRMIRFSLFFHREEYEMTLWRLTEGKYDGAARGNWVAGSVPYGYRYNPRTQTLEPDEDEAEIVRQIFRWYGEERLGYRWIAARLQQHGHLSPRGKREWHPEVIRRILRNPAYRGTLTFRKTERHLLTGKVVRRPERDHIVVEDAFEPLVDPALWEACQRNQQRRVQSPPVAAHKTLWELAGLIYCHDCGGKLVRQGSRRKYHRKDGHTSVYVKEFLYCPRCRYAVKYRDCEAQLINAMDCLHFDKATLAAETHKVDARHPLRSIRREWGGTDATVLTARLQRARELLLDGTLTKEEYLETKAQYERQLAAAKTKVHVAADAKQAADGGCRVGEDTVRTHLSSIERWSDLYRTLSTPALRNQLLRSLFENIQLQLTHKGGGKKRTAKFDLYIASNLALEQQRNT
ncbi:recombinase family protein [Alicyclobacillus pomorum]|uniref:recombinase family protein n=1 Tax=Alicyclobacillus pomorum TaxID=204470 RepID=UPI0003F91FB4|nr:recombinase family protein [Alicyclobacillus pomorum]